MIKELVLLMSGFGLLCLIAGCAEDELNIDVESSVPVRVEEVGYKSIEEYAYATGTVSAINESEIKAQQSGYYQLQTNPRTGKAFAMGDRVLQGEVVVKLFNPEFENQVTFESKKLNYEISSREYEKQKVIHEKGGITLRELTDAERTYIDSKYAYENAVIQLEKLNATALFNGIIVDLPFFSDNQLVEAGALLVQIMDYKVLHTEVLLPGKEMDRVQSGQISYITNYGKIEDTLLGTVTQVSPALDPDSRMFKLSIEITNDSLILRPGMFVKADIVIDSKDSAIVISKDIILERHNSKIIYVVDKGIAVEKKLEIGLSNRDEVEVISGLNPDERLVVEGFETLRHRSKVKVTK